MAETMTAQAGNAAPLDDLMLAMDVVDTMRHQNALIEKEMSEGDREAALIANLRDIYRKQGIAVPDDVLERGVKALREERFVYKGPERGLSYGLARLWVSRARWGKAVLALMLALGIGIGGYYFAVLLPQRQAAETTRIELKETIPAAIDTLLADINREALDESAKARAQALATEGRTAARDGQAEAARKALMEMTALRNELRLDYDIRIVSRPGQISGIERRPNNNPMATPSHYLVVEAVDRNGKVLPRQITAETDGKTATTAIWGQRVAKDVYDRVRQDKAADGIIQNNILGRKERGRLEPTWLMPVQKGTVLELK